MFDEEFTAILGIRTAFFEYLLLLLVAIAVVVLIRIVGIILVMALLTAPAAIAGMFAASLKSRMIYSAILGNAFCVVGLWASYALNIASGASIVILSVTCYLLSYAVYVLERVVKKKKTAALSE